MKIRTLSPEAMKKYGCLIDFNSPQGTGFEIIVTEPDSGWRIALFEFNRQSISRLERHPESLESFEPLSGTGIILLAEDHRPDDMEAFLLDRPICLNKGVWHEVLSLSQSTTVKITENLEVNSEFHPLKSPLGIQLISL